MSIIDEDNGFEGNDKKGESEVSTLINYAKHFDNSLDK